MASTLDTLGQAQYVLVTTYRKDGRAVPTAAWVVRDDDALAIWTVVDSGKVKRIRRNPDVLIGPCDIRGNPTGESTPARAELLDSIGTDRIRRLLKKKYGVTGRITLLLSRLRRGLDGTVGIRITPS